MTPVFKSLDIFPVNVSPDLFFDTLSHLRGLQQPLKLSRRKTLWLGKRLFLFFLSSNLYSNWLKDKLLTITFSFLSLPGVAEGNASKPPEV